MRGFMEFIRHQGVVGLAVGFLLGGAVSKVVTALVTDLINPLLSIALGFAGGIKGVKWNIAGVDILVGDFISVLIDFLIIAAVVYYGVKGLGLDRLDKKKEAAA